MPFVRWSIVLTAERSKKPTLKTIAYMTGLGITTVSKALKDAPDIKDTTKQRVKMIAEEIGYQPDRAGQRLRTGKNNIISLVMNTQDEISNMTTEFMIGVTDALKGTAYNLVLTPYWHKDDPMKPVRNIVDSRGADGIILSRIELVDPRIAYLQKAGLPFATHGRSDMGIDHAYCDFDGKQFAHKAVQRLAEAGAKRVCVLQPPMNLAFAQYTHEGFLMGLKETGLDSLSLPSVTQDDTVETIAEHVEIMLNNEVRPDGFICSSVTAAIGIAGGIENAGLVVGKDVKVVAKQSNVNLLKWFGRDMYDVEENFREAGYCVASSLLRVIDGDNASNHQNIVFPEVWGRSVLR